MFIQNIKREEIFRTSEGLVKRFIYYTNYNSLWYTWRWLLLLLLLVPISFFAVWMMRKRRLAAQQNNGTGASFYPPNAPEMYQTDPSQAYGPQGAYNQYPNTEYGASNMNNGPQGTYNQYSNTEYGAGNMNNGSPEYPATAQHRTDGDNSDYYGKAGTYDNKSAINANNNAGNSYGFPGETNNVNGITSVTDTGVQYSRPSVPPPSHTEF
ncbi:hypothetical protein BABINDRAFT_177583 [Babjeviella inositovora NRRL Y-12698]|uniref:Uncharacterized protein n=1 Tax=Babjeviella inositovora NRRL Y-12698 TaxID=984486 RepID=A0A1E3QK44_9ASCO|nr:uncharacterized protein BABINDRAFT_177583 [Babjeviella inositovora NRRL Y-12698]ODQ77988.1 hypothetical protein BABINDRAFT_177583 [Babjeviella inositovora NRRL Y-12698]